MRKSGILMHISSLPGPYGVGSMGASAYAFVDFLVAAGQSCWQILPLSPTGYGDSPYQSFSTFAGNHYLIDLDTLIGEGLLLPGELEGIDWGSEPGRVDFGKLYNERARLLKIAFSRFEENEDFREFVRENGEWLEDYALFMAIKEHFRGRDWQNWSVSLLMRLRPVMDAYREELRDSIRFQYFLQFKFFEQWRALRSYANERGIKIIGDVPIYVPLDSADVWANPELFQLDASRRPTVVAGCPPDSFSADGQLWGNPIYDWGKMHEERYHWWIRRMKAAARMYDVVRFDHFRGFESYWAVPAGAKTAASGAWKKGPGMDFVGAIKRALPELDIIAEDLGFVTPEVKKLLKDSGYPGMKVMEFAFDTREPSAKDYLPHTYPAHSVVYSGTHDNLTLKQWFAEAKPEDVENAIGYLGLNEQEGYIWGVIRGAMGSVSELCIIQMQDYLEVGAEGRMNHPGTLTSANWTWRAEADFASDALAQKIRSLTARYGRA
ncbi:MAG: 4-alpha-glucanotransferase [Oscillospiraceae bacterium]|nr:4-alpha-glucanotransferase [Oscillospiraceae bacterium]